MSVRALGLIPLAALLFYSVLAIINARQERKGSVNRSFTHYLLSMIVWSFASWMIFADLGIGTTLFWNRFMVLGSVAMPITFFAFVQVFVRKQGNYWLSLGYLIYSLTQITNFSGHLIQEAHLEAGLLVNVYGPALIIPSLSWVLFIGLAAFYLGREYRGTKDMLYRNRIKYLLITNMVIFAGSLTNITHLQVYPVDIAFNVFSALLIAYAILRHQLLDITVVIRKGLLYSIPTTIIGTAYFLIISLALRLFHTSTSPQVFLLSFGVAILTALAAQPVRDKVQAWIDRMFFREKYDASRMLQRLSRSAATVLDLDRLSRMILDEITGNMHIERAAFFLKRGASGDFYLASQKGMQQDLNLRMRRDHPIVQFLSTHESGLSKNDMEILPAFKSLWEQEVADLQAVGAELFIPLKSKGELVGIFTTGPKLSGETYSPDDQQTLITLANQTAVAIENARLFDAEAKRRREAELLRKAQAELTSALELEQVLDSILTHLDEVMPYDSACLFLTREDRLEAVAARGFREPEKVIGRDYPIEEDKLFLEIRRSQKPVILDNAASDPRFKDWGQAHTVSWMGVPLVVRGQVIGCLTLDNQQLAAYSEAEADLARAFVSHASVAIENARLFSDAQRRAQEAETLRQASAVVAVTLDLKEAIHNILDQLKRVVPYDSASVQLINEGSLEVFGGRGWPDPDFMIGDRFELGGEAPQARVIQQRLALRIDDVPAEEPVLLQSVHSLRIRSWLGAPLVVHDRAIGLLAVDHQQAGFFTANHARLITAFADQVAVAIENARLYDLEKQRAGELAILFESSSAITTRLDMNSVLQTTAEQIARAVDGTSAYVMSCDLESGSATVLVEYFSPEALPKERVSDIGTSYDLQAYPQTLEALRKGQPSITRLSDELDDPYARQHLEAYGGKCSLRVPLMAGSQVRGYVVVWDSRRERIWSDEEVRLCQTLANQAAIALENARLFAEVQRLAVIDSLTNVNNRRQLFELGERELHRTHRFQRQLSAVMIDIDDFKQINDKLGHACGDEVLQVLAEIFRKSLRDVDILGRYGGDEFVILLTETDEKEAFKVAERMRSSVVETPIQTQRGPANITISIGVAEATPLTRDLAALIDCADAAMYTAKQAGRNQVMGRGTSRLESDDPLGTG